MRRQPARIFHDVRAVHDGFFKFKFVFGQPRFKFRVRHAHVVRAHRLTAAIRRPCRDRFRFIRAVGGNQARRQRGRDGIFFRYVGFHIRFAVGQRQFARIARADDAAQNGVHQRRHALAMGAPRLLDRFVHRRMIGNFIHEQNLRRRDVQNIDDFGIGASFGKPRDHAIDAQAVFQRRIEQAGGQTAIRIGELRRRKRAIQRLRSIGVFPHHIAQRPQRHIARAIPCGLLFRAPCAPRRFRIRSAANRLPIRILLTKRLFIERLFIEGSLFKSSFGKALRAASVPFVHEGISLLYHS